MERGRVFQATKVGGDGRRASLDIIADMLDVSCRRVGKTELMSMSNMSFAQLEKYLDLILYARLIVVENYGPKVLFRTSSKGRKFLKKYESLQTLMK